MTKNHQTLFSPEKPIVPARDPKQCGGGKRILQYWWWWWLWWWWWCGWWWGGCRGRGGRWWYWGEGCWGEEPIPRPGSTLCASLRSRNAHGQGHKSHLVEICRLHLDWTLGLNPHRKNPVSVATLFGEPVTSIMNRNSHKKKIPERMPHNGVSWNRGTLAIRMVYLQQWTKWRCPEMELQIIDFHRIFHSKPSVGIPLERPKSENTPARCCELCGGPRQLLIQAADLSRQGATCEKRTT